MLVYHRTYSPEAIVESGFRDGKRSYLTSSTHRGVWVADRALDVNEGAMGDVILVVDVPADVLEPFEWAEEGKPYREFLVPADVLNRYPIVAQIPDWMPDDDLIRRRLGLPERRPGWQLGDPLWPN
jgi:hypothetical protein